MQISVNPERSELMKNPNMKPSQAPCLEIGAIYWNNKKQCYVEIIGHANNKVVTAYILDNNGHRIPSMTFSSEKKYALRVMQRRDLAWNAYLPAQGHNTIPPENTLQDNSGYFAVADC